MIFQFQPEYESLEENIATVEHAIGDYSEFYVTVSSDRNQVCHSIGGIDVNDTIFVLLPQDVPTDNLVLDFYTGWEALLGSYVCNFEKHPVYKVKDRFIVCVQSDLPFAFIDVDHDALSRVNSSHSESNPEKEKAAVQFCLVKGDSLNPVNDLAGEIKPRGATSWSLYNKRPYSLKFDNHVNLMDMGSNKKWNLIANASDKTLLKNQIFYHLAENLDLPYTPKMQNVNLFINDSYVGVYAITTKVDRFCKNTLTNGDFLINISSPNAKIPIYYACDYVTELDEETDEPFVDLVYPENGVTFAYKDYVQTTLQEYVDVLENRKQGNLEDYIDIDSFAKYYWVQEISMNADAWYRSCYLYYKDGKFYAGPVWDFDYTLGSVGMLRGSIDFMTPDGWKVRDYSFYVPMFTHPEFKQRVDDVYFEYDIPGLMEQAYDELCCNAEALALDGDLNYQTDEEINWSDFDYDTIETYTDYVNEKLKFFRQRIDWIEHEMCK